MKILLVDDDEFILNLVQKSLEKVGHSVEVADSTETALAHLAEGHGFNLVITDIVMPGQDGGELAKHVKSLEPKVPVITITGGIENAIEDYAVYAEMFSDETLSKPFRSDELMAAVERVTASAA
ncbi:MAG: response regulator [Pseudomonadota bacterium]